MTMLPELPENEATGEIARIYQEIKATTHVPYVSSLQRHLATRPGWLEWCWSVVGPGFLSGSIPAAVWQVATKLDTPTLTPQSRSALQAIGVDAHSERAIHNVLDSFIRVSPTNLGFSGIIRAILLREVTVDRSPIAVSTASPTPLDPLPDMLDINQLTPQERDVLLTMATTVDGQVFVPGLYRMLARWPGWFEHAVNELVAQRSMAARACDALATSIDAIVPSMFSELVVTEPPLTQGCNEAVTIVNAIDRYRETSPQMVVYCRMLKTMLPAQS